MTVKFVATKIPLVPIHGRTLLVNLAPEEKITGRLPDYEILEIWEHDCYDLPENVKERMEQRITTIIML